MICDDLDVLVIGGGQAGLAMGYHLKQAGYRFQIVERNARLGDSWRNRYDSLVLFTPRAYSALPGLSVLGDPEGYPGKDEIADYLEQYTDHFDLPVSMDTGIRCLTRLDGGFRARTDSGEIVDARAVVLATGAFQRPAAPAISRRLSPDVLQLSPESYKGYDRDTCKIRPLEPFRLQMPGFLPREVQATKCPLTFISEHTKPEKPLSASANAAQKRLEQCLLTAVFTKVEPTESDSTRHRSRAATHSPKIRRLNANAHRCKLIAGLVAGSRWYLGCTPGTLAPP